MFVGVVWTTGASLRGLLDKNNNMFAKKKKAPQPKGQGAAAAKQVTTATTHLHKIFFLLACGVCLLPCTSCFQMGLFVELDPEEMMMGMEGSLDDPDLEAELAAITGNKAAGGGRAKPKGKSECKHGRTMRQYT